MNSVNTGRFCNCRFGQCKPGATGSHTCGRRGNAIRVGNRKVKSTGRSIIGKLGRRDRNDSRGYFCDISISKTNSNRPQLITSECDITSQRCNCLGNIIVAINRLNRKCDSLIMSELTRSNDQVCTIGSSHIIIKLKIISIIINHKRGCPRINFIYGCTIFINLDFSVEFLGIRNSNFFNL